MNTAANVFLLIAGILFLFDVVLIIAKRPNPVNKNWPLPCPVTLACLGIGLILSSINSF